MKGTVWDKYWKQKEEIDIERIIENDPYYRLLKRLIRLQRNERLNILEAGCGSGARTLALLREFKDCPLNAVLVDISSSALYLAKKVAEKNKIEANFVLADVFNLPFLKAFDIVWNEGVNEHFNGEKRQKVFEEMSRVCKEGGKVIVIVPNALNLTYRITKKILEMKGKWIYGFEKPYTLFELKNRMRNAGITCLRIGGAGVIVPVLSFLQLILKRVNGKMGRNNGKYQALKKSLRIFESICEVVLGPLLAKDIGVSGKVLGSRLAEKIKNQPSNYTLARRN